jgi:predicted nuclease with TOPRIM domain
MKDKRNKRLIKKIIFIRDLDNVKHVLQSYERNVQGIMREIFEINKKLKEINQAKNSPNSSPENRSLLKAYEDRLANLEANQKELEATLPSFQQDLETRFGEFSNHIGGDLEKISQEFQKVWTNKVETIFEQMEIKIQTLEEGTARQEETKVYVDSVRNEMSALVEKRFKKFEERLQDLSQKLTDTDLRQRNEGGCF